MAAVHEKSVPYHLPMAASLRSCLSRLYVSCTSLVLRLLLLGAPKCS